MASVPVQAQNTLEGLPIKTIEAQSNIRFTGNDIHRLTGIKPGDAYSAKAVRKSLDILYRTGLFTDIRVETAIQEGGIVLRYVFFEKHILSSVTFKGTWTVLPRKLKKNLGMQVGDEFTEQRWKKSISDLMAFFQNRGHFQVETTSDIIYEKGSNRVDVTVTIKEGRRAKIRETRFTGNVVFKRLRLWPKIGSREERNYKREQVEKDLQNLESFYYSQGYLQAAIGPPEVRYHASTNEVTLIFPIDAGTRLQTRFEGNPAVPDETLANLLTFREEHSYGEHVLEDSADNIRRYYKANGYPLANVSWARREEPKNETVIAAFEINEGPLACLRALKIEGNNYFSAAELRDLISTLPSETPFYCRPVNFEILEKDMNKIRSAYHKEGFLRMRIDRELVLPEEAERLQRIKAGLILTIDEGVQTRVEEIEITGNRAFLREDLTTHLNHLPGYPYDRSQAEEDIISMMRFYRQRGYIYSKIELDERFSEDHSRVHLNYTIHEEGQVRIGQIFLQGNSFTKDYVIKRELTIDTGDAYNEEEIQLSRHRIIQLRYLRNIRIRPVNPLSQEPREYEKDMVLSARERPPKILEFGIGYGDEDRLRGFAQLAHINLGGTGRSLILRGEASSIERKTSVNFLEPWVLGFPVDGRVSGVFEIQDKDAYALNSIGGLVGIDRKLTNTLTASLVYQIEFDNFTRVPEDVLKPEDKGRVNIATINPSLILDTRDNPFDPHRGTLSALAFRIGAKSLGSQVQLRKVTIESNWFFPLTRWLVLGFSARTGFVDRFGDSKDVPPNERFFIGGRTTVRGYELDELGIVGDTISADTGEPVGGKFVLNGNLEFRIFLPAGLGLVLFTDHGNVWFHEETLKDKDNDNPVDFGEVDLGDIKTTVGVGLRYNTPVGPIRIDVGYKLDREDNLCPNCIEPVEESQYEIHFTLGHAF